MKSEEAERGSASVLALALIGVLVAVVSAALVVSGAFVAHRRAAVAADAAALAAADAASGRASGVPCVQAERLAAVNGARLDSCRARGAVVTVDVSTAYLGMRSTAEARAGPPGSPAELP